MSQDWLNRDLTKGIAGTRGGPDQQGGPPPADPLSSLKAAADGALREIGGRVPKKYVVPEGMLKAVIEHHPSKGNIADDPHLMSTTTLNACLEAAIRWQAENPPKASMKQLQEMFEKVDQGNGGTYIPSCLEEWIRRMYLAPEPEFNPATKSILLSMRGVTFTPAEAEAIVEELSHVAHGWDRRGIKSNAR